MNLDIKDGKTYCSILELKEWDKNPRSIKENDFYRLKKQIETLGQYKPLIVNSGKLWGEAGVVAGGNMRIKAYRELQIDKVWVSLIEPKDEAEFLAYALSDNDRAGFYDTDLLANLMPNYPDFKWEDYAVDLGEPLTLDNLARIGDVSTDFDRLKVITIEPPEAPVLKERVSVYFETIEDYELVKSYLGERPGERLLGLIKDAKNI